MSDSLPDFKSSLSKYIRVEDHYRILASIHHDMPETELRRRFNDELLTTAKQRYLVMDGRTVVRDKLIDLIHEEGTLTQRVRMNMYFLFMFRDRGYREFICTIAERQNGRWDTAVFRGATHTSYFAGAGGHKAFTNLRQFLFQIGVLNEQTLTADFPKPDSWFPAAVEIAVQS